jgi:hypothetical protein
MRTMVTMIQKSQMKMLITHSLSNLVLIMLKIISVMRRFKKKRNKRMLQIKIKKKKVKRRKVKKTQMQ